MNINELQEDIQDHKKRLADAYNETAELTLPFFMLHQKLFEGACKIQEKNYKLGNSETDVLITALVSGDEHYTITPTKLHQKLLFTTAAITKVLKKLEKKGYVLRVNNEQDKRSKLVRLTSKGVVAAKGVFRDIIDFQENIFGTLTNKEKKTLQKVLVKILKQT